MSASFIDSILALDQQLIQLVYRSRSLIEGAEYEKLMATCLRNNPSRGVTGVLISHSGWFLQVLEGTAANVSSLFKVIENDPRHSDFLLLRFNAVAVRDFSDWSMASITVDEQRFIHPVLREMDRWMRNLLMPTPVVPYSGEIMRILPTLCIPKLHALALFYRLCSVSEDPRD